MKAVIECGYGPPADVLSVREVATPVPKAGEVLVQLRAASMHTDVWHVLAGFPAVLRLKFDGLRTPRPIPGTDSAASSRPWGRTSRG